MRKNHKGYYEPSFADTYINDFKEEYIKINPPPKSEYRVKDPNTLRNRYWNRPIPYKIKDCINNIKDEVKNIKLYMEEERRASHNPNLTYKDIHLAIYQIDEFIKKQHKWDEELKESALKKFQYEQRMLDELHVRKTGKCCGQTNSYWSTPRTCSRKAKKGNFCTQHAKKVSEYRL